MRTLRALLFALTTAWAGEALAEDKPTILVQVDVGTSGLSADVVRTAIGRELGVATPSEGAASSSLAVKIVGNRARVAFVRSSGEKLEREVELPREVSSRVEVIALLAGNLARDEATALLEAMKKPEPAPEPSAEPAPEPQPKRPDPPPEQAKEASATAPPEADAKGAAPEARAERGPFAWNLSLWHPIAVDGSSEQRRYDLEAGLAYSRIGALSGFGLTVGHLRIDGPAHGVGVAGLWTRISHDARGAFAAGIFAESWGRLEGAEGAGFVALRRGDVDGFQGAGIFASASRVRGVQMSGIASWANGAISGAQGGGALAYARGDVEGAQIALVNVGANVQGAQIGLVNVGGDVRGSQVGVVNVSDRVDGLPLGIVNVVKHGRTQAVAWADTLVLANAAVKYLNGPIYTLVGAGYDGGDGAAAAFALGGRVQLSRASYLEIDALYRYLSDFDDTDSDEDRHLSAARVLVGLEGLGPAGAFVGGGVSHDVDSHGNGSKVRAYGVAGVTLF